MSNLTHQELLNILDYNPITGEFFWKAETARKIKIGQKAGTKHSGGYLTIRIKGIKYYAHILAWFYHYGVWPKGMLDHEDTVRNNNAIKNLRPASNSENAQNLKPHRDNECGFKGVAKNRSKFSAKIYVQSKNVHLGSFEKPEDAARAYDAAALKHFGPFALTNQQLGLVP